MESPIVLVDERERERVASSPSFPRRHKILFGVFVSIGILVYAAFNVWVYLNATSGKIPTPNTLRQAVKNAGSGFPELIGLGPFTPTSPAKQDLAPPDTGPGQYACDEYGICNNYEDAKRVGCPKTYADLHCLNECGDTKIWCQKQK